MAVTWGTPVDLSAVGWGGNLSLTSVPSGAMIGCVLTQVTPGAGTAISVSSDLDGALTQAVYLGANRVEAIFYLHGASAGNHTLTVTSDSGSESAEGVPFYATGLDGSASPIVGVFDSVTGVTTHYCAASGEIDTTTGALIVTNGVVDGNEATLTQGGSYTKVTAITTLRVLWQYQEAASAVTDERGAWTSGGSSRGQSVMAAFPVASAGGTTYQESVTLAAVAAMTDTSRAVFRSSVAMTAEASVTDTSRADFVAASTLAAVAGFAASASATFPASFSLTADATLSAAARADLVGAATLAADAGLSAVSVAQMVAALTLTADAPLAASARLLAVAAATLTANATLTASDGGAQTYQESISLAANATLVHASVLQAVAAASLTADASLTGDAALRAAASLAFTLQATIDAAARQMHAAAVALDAQTGITAASRADYVDSLTLAVAAVLQAAGAVAGAPSYAVLKIASESLRAATGGSDAIRAADVTGEELT